MSSGAAPRNSNICSAGAHTNGHRKERCPLIYRAGRRWATRATGAMDGESGRSVGERGRGGMIGEWKEHERGPGACVIRQACH